MNTEKIKQSGKSNVLVWIIVALLCLNLITCTRSCKNDRKFKRELREARQADSVIALRNATIDTLKHELDIAATEKKGLEQQLKITSEAVNQITEAKKNITVSVRQKK
jgi:hypothetical protein